MRLSPAWRRRLTARRVAQAAIAIELLVVFRTLGEIYRLRGEQGSAFVLEAAMAWITGAVIALGFLTASVLLYFAGRDRPAAIAALGMVGVLVVYKAVVIGLD